MATARALTLKQACAKYPNRYTVDHVPAWALTPCEGNGLYYAPQFASDVEWYNNTKFHGELGHMFKNSDCYTSGQTWPVGKWLNAPFNRGGVAVDFSKLAETPRIDVLHEKLRNLHALLEDDTDFDAWVVELANSPQLSGYGAAVEYIKQSVKEEEGEEEEEEEDNDDAKFIDAANELYSSENIEFDDLPQVSPSEKGAFVQAWVWVSNEQAGIVDDEEGAQS